MASLLDLTKVWVEARLAAVGPDDTQERMAREALFDAAKNVFAVKAAKPLLVKVTQSWCDMCAIKIGVKAAFEIDPSIRDDSEENNPEEDPDANAFEWAILGAMLLTVQSDARQERVPFAIWTCDDHHEQLAVMRATLADFLKKREESAKSPS